MFKKIGGREVQFAYVIIRGEGVRDLLIFADKGGGRAENCKKHAYVIFEQPLYDKFKTELYTWKIIISKQQNSKQYVRN